MSLLCLRRAWRWRGGGAGDVGVGVSGERGSEGHGGPTARRSAPRPRQRHPGPSAAGPLPPQVPGVLTSSIYKVSFKGAVCSLGEGMLMSRERSSLADFFLPKHTNDY